MSATSLLHMAANQLCATVPLCCGVPYLLWWAGDAHIQVHVVTAAVVMDMVVESV